MDRWTDPHGRNVFLTSVFLWYCHTEILEGWGCWGSSKELLHRWQRTREVTQEIMTQWADPRVQWGCLESNTSLASGLDRNLLPSSHLALLFMFSTLWYRVIAVLFLSVLTVPRTVERRRMRALGWRKPGSRCWGNWGSFHECLRGLKLMFKQITLQIRALLPAFGLGVSRVSGERPYIGIFSGKQKKGRLISMEFWFICGET